MIRFLFDVISLVFWTIILYGSQWVLSLVCFFVPTFVFERLGIALLDKHRIKVTRDKNVAGNYDKNKYDCELIVHNPKYFKRSFIEGSRGMGESYMVSVCSHKTKTVESERNTNSLSWCVLINVISIFLFSILIAPVLCLVAAGWMVGLRQSP